MTEPATDIIFIRHGETDWNRDRRIQGRAEVGLNAVGLGQARAAALRLGQMIGGTDRYDFHTSPSLRARQTMLAVVAALRLDDANVRRDERLAEREFGEFEGRTWPELFAAGGDPADDPEAFYHWRPKGGESYADVVGRVGGWLAELRGPVVVVSHSGVSRALRGLVLGLTKAEIVHLPVPQDRFFRLAEGRIEWFDLP